MGRDKAKLRFDGKTLLGHVRTVAKATGWPVRIIRKDLVPRCGPLGGIVTALRTSRSGAVLFLACDMPFITVGLLKSVVSKLSRGRLAAFSVTDDGAGFPFVIPAEALPVIERQLADKAYSLQRLAVALGARRVRVPKSRQGELQNINTPEEWLECRVGGFIPNAGELPAKNAKGRQTKLVG